MSGEDFNWREDSDSIVVPEQFAIAIYENPHGDLVLRQEDRYGDEDDWIVVAKHNVPALIRALMGAAGLEQPASVTLLPPPSSGAERQRRYRQRHAQRNSGDAVRVTRDACGDGSDANSDGELPLAMAAE